MADGFLGDLGNILTGGLQSALDLEIAERIGRITATGQPDSPRGDTDRGIRTDDGRVIRAGQSSFAAQVAAVPPVVWIGAVASLVALVLLLRR